jgi:DNA-binding LacI/PurR family transcriptional regulator
LLLVSKSYTALNIVFVSAHGERERERERERLFLAMMAQGLMITKASNRYRMQKMKKKMVTILWPF